MIQWLEQERFRLMFRSNYAPNGRHLRAWHDLGMNLQELRERIPSPPNYTPVGDGDFPGPVERWYGEVDGHLFLLTWHYYKDRMTIAEFEDSAEARAAVVNALEAFKQSKPGGRL